MASPSPSPSEFAQGNPGSPIEIELTNPRGNPFPIVGIGASAGGLEAFGQLLDAIPANTGMAFVLVQHLDPLHASQLTELLAPHANMPIVTVRDEMRAEPDHIYVIPPNTSIVLEDDHFRLPKRESGIHLPIDIFFRSLAQVQGSRAIGVVLSGNASDGSQGLLAIKAECGLTFAQDEASARFGGMPRSAVLTGAVDFVLNPQEIGRELAGLGRHPFLIKPDSDQPSAEILPSGDKELKSILGMLQKATNVDFSSYKPTTVRRRIGRRMMILRQETLAEYASYSEKHPSELRELYKDLLISVTSFFRDPEVYAALSEALEADMQRLSAEDRTFRVWVAGCATGEEVYSLAMLLQETLEKLQLRASVQLFGTDISEVAVARARQAIYPDTIAGDVAPERLTRFFHKVDRGYQVVKSIREQCIFARHDVTRDPPFSNLNLASCRNLLIYLNSTLQARVLPTFHYALKQNGLLMLGTAESISSADDLFAPVNKQCQIYRRKTAPVRMAAYIELNQIAPAAAQVERTGTPISALDLQRKVDKVVQSRYSPDAVLVNSDLQILQFRGRTHQYLTPSSGEASLNLLRMAHDSLVIPIRRAIQGATDRNASVQENATFTAEPDTAPTDVQIEVTPIAGSGPGDRYFLIVFRALTTEASGVLSPGAQTDERIKRLTQELIEAREYVRNLTEDYEAHAEELRAANEEARSANEELQSTNEELGTTKEELQSANEELTTVNEELQSRNAELNATNGDLKNLLAAASLAIVMVDQDYRIRRFNNAAEKLIGLTAIDIGRPIGHLRGSIATTRLEEQVHSVIETLNPIFDQVKSKDGLWFSVGVRPYRTLDNRIAGAVITIQDIDSLKRALEAAEEARDYAEGMIKTVREPLVVLDSDLRVIRATSAFYETFLISRDETEGRLLYDLGSGQWNQPRLRELLGYALFRQEPFHDYEVTYNFPHIGIRTMRLNGQRIPLPDDKPRVLLLAIEDMTERRELAEIRFQRLFETAKDGIVVVDTETKLVTDVNPYTLELTGLRREDFISRPLHELRAFQSVSGLAALLADLEDDSILRLDDAKLIRKDGSDLCVEIVGNRYLVGTQRVVQLNIRDITARIRATRDLQASERRFRLFLESVKDYGMIQLDPAGCINTWTSGAERQFGWSEAEALGKPSAMLFTPEDVAAGAARTEIETARRDGRAEDERWHIRKDRSRFFASGVLTRVDDDEGRLIGFAKIMRDVTERRAVEDRLKQQAALLELAHDAILVRQLDGRILFWNRGAERLYGWSAPQALGKLSHELLRSKFPEPLGVINDQLLQKGNWDGVLEHAHQRGTQIFVASRWALQMAEGDQPARVLEINVDVTAAREQEEGLQRSVEEKSMLVREIHHRVKNNLQVIVSLLSLQANHIKDPRVVAAFEETESRVRAIAQIHERLYASDDLTEVEFAGYLTHLSQELVALYATQPNQVKLSLHLQEMVLHIEQAVPLGLIANELIINSLKHGLRDQPGTLEVSLIYLHDRIRAELGETLDDGWAQVRIKDSGPGLPEGLDFARSQSLGFRLITLLVRQLRGHLRTGEGPGADITLDFPLRGTAELS